jgi:hypothetical protein
MRRDGLSRRLGERAMGSAWWGYVLETVQTLYTPCPDWPAME